MPKLAFNPKKTSFDLVNAHSLAQAAQLAYKSKEDVLKRLKGWGFANASFFSRKGTQGYVAGNDEMILVAFRGTEPKEMEDLMADAKIKRVPGKGGGHVHRGFKAALEAVSTDMAKAVNRLRDREQPVFVTGHSLGAALAGLAVGASRTEGVPIAALYTYGMPRIGNKHYYDNFQKAFGKRAFRIVNNNDSVTRVPPRAFGYKHVGTVKYLDSAGKLAGGATSWRRFLVRFKGQIEGRIDHLFKPGTDGLKDHGIRNYVRILKGLLP